jgi:hypothetical protein
VLIDARIDLTTTLRSSKNRLIAFSQHYSDEIQENILMKLRSFESEDNDFSIVELSLLDIADIMGNIDHKTLIYKALHSPSPRHQGFFRTPISDQAHNENLVGSSPTLSRK